MNSSWLVLVMGISIGLLHLRGSHPPMPDVQNAAVDWPAEFEGQVLHPLPLSGMEEAFAASFPGAIAHFRCGDRQVIFRKVTRATRRLHSSATCLKAAGYKVQSVTADIHRGQAWASYGASRGGTTLQVREQVRSASDPRRTWTEVSHWFWHATFHPDDGPWIAVTVLHQ